MEQEFLKGLDTDKVNPFVEQCIAQKESLNTVSSIVCALYSVKNLATSGIFFSNLF